MGYLVVSPCMNNSGDAVAYAASLPVGYQIVTCSATSPFVELTVQQKTDLFLEGHALGWAVAGVMVIAWAISYVRRAL